VGKYSANQYEFVKNLVIEVVNHYQPIQFNIGGWLVTRLKSEYPNYPFYEEELEIITLCLASGGCLYSAYNRVGARTYVLSGYKYNPHGCAPYEKYDDKPIGEDRVDKTKKFWLLVDDNFKGSFTTNIQQEVIDEAARLVRVTGKEYIILSSDGRVSPSLPPIKYERY
jgi:hypothetical protein